MIIPPARGGSQSAVPGKGRGGGGGGPRRKAAARALPPWQLIRNNFRQGLTTKLQNLSGPATSEKPCLTCSRTCSLVAVTPSIAARVLLPGRTLGTNCPHRFSNPNYSFCQTSARAVERAHANAMSLKTAGSLMAATTLTNSTTWARSRQTNSAVIVFADGFLTGPIPNLRGCHCGLKS